MSDEQKFSEETRLEVLKMAVDMVDKYTNSKHESQTVRKAMRALGCQDDEQNATVPDLVKHVYSQLLDAMTP